MLRLTYPLAVAGAEKPESVQVTPVSGPSTLRHLSRTISTSSMGWGGQWSALPGPVRPASKPAPADRPGEQLTVTGADLYRISCRACHRPDGSGSPPEINTILDPVRAASDRWMVDRMKERGRPVDTAYIHGLTAATESDLQKRLREGGHNMPSFDHLSTDEIATLRPYLDFLAGLPGAESRQRNLIEPEARVGELIIKGTCHICHDAVGRDDIPVTALSGVIPPLSALTRLKSFEDFQHKIREGAPVALGSAGIMTRGRMPVFAYLSEAEAVTAYDYLIRYRPR